MKNEVLTSIGKNLKKKKKIRLLYSLEKVMNLMLHINLITAKIGGKYRSSHYGVRDTHIKIVNVKIEQNARIPKSIIWLCEGSALGIQFRLITLRRNNKLKNNICFKTCITSCSRQP